VPATRKGGDHDELALGGALGEALGNRRSALDVGRAGPQHRAASRERGDAMRGVLFLAAAALLAAVCTGPAATATPGP
jgi:hypothetical protein